jgi:LacI family gluconate utilization system Gnt-I transcriptional repressor
LVGTQLTADLIAAYPQVDSIFSANDDLALGGLFHAMAANIAIPDDLAYLVPYGIEIGKATPIQLSSVETPRFEMGSRAAALLLVTEAEGAQTVDLDFEIFSGGST